MTIVSIFFSRAASTRFFPTVGFVDEGRRCCDEGDEESFDDVVDDVIAMGLANPGPLIGEERSEIC